jgi:hypothetical protein
MLRWTGSTSSFGSAAARRRIRFENVLTSAGTRIEEPALADGTVWTWTNHVPARWREAAATIGFRPSASRPFANLIVTAASRRSTRHGSNEGGFWNVTTIPAGRRSMAICSKLVHSSPEGGKPSDGCRWIDLDGQGNNKRYVRPFPA